MPVRHIVMFTAKDDTKPEQFETLKTNLMGLKGKIPEITACQYFEDLKLPSGQNHPAGKNRSVVFMAEFADAAAYEVYATHPDHKTVIENDIKPIMEPGTRAAMQHEM
mmetsp:Transcript_28907/g.66597  ORF Transcript_28907/g.66597 Transcript_28907/m.66597 type:complete len:108 (+) Transcript_28907:78-401(+)